MVSFPIACFCGALATDIAYADHGHDMGRLFAWLLAAGIIIGVLAAIAGLFDLLATRRGRAGRQICAGDWGSCSS